MKFNLSYNHRLFLISGVLLLFLLQPAKAQQINFELFDALNFYENEQYEEAIPLLIEAMATDENNAEIPVLLVSSFVQLSRYKEALEAGEKAIERFPEEVRLYILTGEAAFNVDMNRAISVYEDLRRVLLNLPGQTSNGVSLNAVNQALSTLYEQRGSALFQSGNITESIAAYRRALRFNSRRMELHFNLAFLLYQSGNKTEAARILEEAIEQFPAEESLRLLLVEIKSGGGSTEDMVRVTRDLHNQFPDNTAYAIAYAVSLFNNNQPLDTIAFLEEMISKHPAEREFYTQLRDIHQMRRSMGAASDVMFRMMNAFPDDFQLKLDYGQSLWFLEQFDKSFDFFSDVYEQRNHPEVGRLAGNTLLLNNKTQEAFEWYQKLVKQWPTHAAIHRETALIAEALEENEKAFALFSAHAALSYDGFSMLKAADYAKTDEQRTTYLEMAQQTMFAPIANYLIARPIASIHQLKDEEIVFLASDMILLSTSLESTRMQQMEQRIDEVSPEITPELFSQDIESIYLNEKLTAFLYGLTTRLPLARAINIFNALIDEHPQQPFLYYQKARVLQTAGENESAFEQLRIANQLGLNTPELHLLMGATLYGMGMAQQAILSFERVLVLDKKNTIAYRQIIDISQREGQLNQLADRWLTRFRNDSSNEVLREFLIEALQKADRNEEARALVRRE
mgnify:CR=1 FL=1